MDQVFKSTCSYCGVGCGIKVMKDSRGRLKVEGDPDHPSNRGMLCSKGRNIHYTVQDRSDRLLYPMMRGNRSQPLQRVEWSTAIQRAAAVFRSLIRRYGPDSVGFYVSGQCLTEEYYLVNKLVKGFIGTNNIDTNSRLCMSSAVTAYVKTFGEDIVPISYDDIELADTFLIAGANPAWCHPILFRRIEKRKADFPDTRIVVVDPRKTQSCAIADLHLKIIPGTDTVLYHALARRILEVGNADLQFIKNHTEAFENYRRQIMELSLRKAARICGITVDDLKLAADYIGESKAMMSLWAMGLNQSVVGVDKNYALINLSLLTGNIGKPGAGPFSLTGQPNAMGGREVGGMATLLAAHGTLANDEEREAIAKFWQVPAIRKSPGHTATQMFDALEKGDMKAIWIICTNPSVSMPHSNKVKRALEKARFVVVQDISDRSDTVQQADLVLPAAGWLEKEGTMTNADRRINYLPKVVSPPGEALPDTEIISRFAREMGFHGFSFDRPSDIYDEWCAMTRNTNIDISGLSHQRLQDEGSFQWPVPFQDHPGTPRMFTDHVFFTNSRKAIFNTSVYRETRSELTNEDYPLILTTGRLRDQWHTMTRTGKVNKLMMHQHVPLLEINPVDAEVRDLKDGELAVVENERGSVRVRINVTDSIREQVVFLPMHWGKKLDRADSRVNNLTDDLIDPASKQPNFKYSAVQVKPYKKPVERLLIVGAGAAAFQFIKTYRKENSDDLITVLSKEPDPFYNRILLPDYISEHLEWEQLVKIRSDELDRLQVTVKHATITKIDRDIKVIFDDVGNRYPYDKLIIATGSRPFVPRNVPTHLPGVFTMRQRSDADNLKEYLKFQGAAPRDRHVVVVGGGLLGLEMAGSLRQMGIRVTLVQRASRLMQRQLDRLASNLLADILKERGVQIYFDNEVDTIFENNVDHSLIVTLKSGKTIKSHAIVYAIGVRPNVEPGRECGLECGRGIIVNSYLQTSDPNIFAIGEVAEYNHQIYGITAAAEQQADILSNFLNGDNSISYDGSVSMNILKIDGINLCSIGRIKVPSDDPNYEEIMLMDVSQRFYKKCIVHQDQLIGAILMGDKSEFAEFKLLIENKTELSDKRQELLRGSQSEPVVGAIVCSCNNVGEGNIRQKIAEGCEDFNNLCQKTGAGLGCGSCKSEVQAILEDVMQLTV